MEHVIERPKSSTRSTKVALAALWLVVGGALIGNLVQAIAIVTGRLLVTFGDIDPRLPITVLPQLLQAELRDGSAGYLVDVTLWLRIMCASPLLANSMTIILAAILVAAIIRKIAAGKPFDSRVLRGWKRLSAVLIIGGSVQGLLDTAAGRSIFNLSLHTDTSGHFPLGADYVIISVGFPHWPILIILLGVIAAALAIAFRSGARLESEVDGVV